MSNLYRDIPLFRSFFSASIFFWVREKHRSFAEVARHFSEKYKTKYPHGIYSKYILVKSQTPILNYFNKKIKINFFFWNFFGFSIFHHILTFFIIWTYCEKVVSLCTSREIYKIIESLARVWGKNVMTKKPIFGHFRTFFVEIKNSGLNILLSIKS